MTKFRRFWLKKLRHSKKKNPRKWYTLRPQRSFFVVAADESGGDTHCIKLVSPVTQNDRQMMHWRSRKTKRIKINDRQKLRHRRPWQEASFKPELLHRSHHSGMHLAGTLRSNGWNQTVRKYIDIIDWGLWAMTVHGAVKAHTRDWGERRTVQKGRSLLV